MFTCKYDSLRKLLYFGLCIVAFTAMLFAVGCGKKQAAPPVIPPEKDMGRVDFQGKDASFKTGMTYEEVVTLVGGVEGVEMPMPSQPDAEPGQSSIKQYQWHDTNNNILTCKFQDNKLVEKDIMKLPGSPPPPPPDK